MNDHDHEEYQEDEDWLRDDDDRAANDEDTDDELIKGPVIPFEKFPDEPVARDGRITRYGERMRNEGYKHVVFHNTDYGSTGEMAVYDLSRLSPRYACYGDPDIRLMRSFGGCGTSEIEHMNMLRGSPALMSLLHHLFLSKIACEPGPKLLLGIATAKPFDDWKVVQKFQSPHDNWDDRSLYLCTLAHDKVKSPVNVPPYLYVPCNWDWDANHKSFNLTDYVQLAARAKPFVKKYTQKDIDNIPYLQELYDAEKKADVVREEAKGGTNGSDGTVAGGKTIIPAAANKRIADVDKARAA